MHRPKGSNTKERNVKVATHLLSGLRFSTAVCVWFVVSTDTSSPFGPLVVDTTSYSDNRSRNVMVL